LHHLYLKLTSGDKVAIQPVLFLLFLSGSFACTEKPQTQLFDEFFDQYHLKKNPELILKANQCYNLLKFQHGIILVGNVGCGKSTILEAIHYLTNSNQQILNRKSLFVEEFCGQIDAFAGEWKVEMVFSKSLTFQIQESRMCNSPMVQLIQIGLKQ
jgi:dynein heavy chain 1